jgi:hypothetical protein
VANALGLVFSSSASVVTTVGAVEQLFWIGQNADYFPGHWTSGEPGTPIRDGIEFPNRPCEAHAPVNYLALPP